MEFSEFNLHPDLQRGIADAGYRTCMPVQEQVLSSAFGGQDLYVQSQTGTGKTAAFLVVIFQRLLAEPLLGGKKAIIMVPTRELAVQVEEEARVLGKYLPFKSGSFYGGVGYAQQQGLLKDNVQILVGTPGRVLDLNSSGLMNLMDIAFLVLDEADRMFDMGFYPDLRKLIKVVPPADRRQTMLFSATLNTWVKNLAWEYTKTPLEIEIEPETVTVDEVEQVLYHVSSEDKMRLLLGILHKENPESAIIFCNTKRYAEIVAKRLRINGFDCEFIIGDLPQVKRLAIIDGIKAGKIRYLAATDVAARGLDIEGLALVVNYDIPSEAENYVHRIGRTARAGKTGKAVTLASEQDVYELTGIERYIGKKIPSEVASADLYGEDKSGGVRIRTGFYDDRGRGREEPGGSRSWGGQDRERRPGGSRERSAGRGERQRDRGDRRGSRPGGHKRRPRPAEILPGGEGASQEPEALSRLPLEERMAYYREKYSHAPGEARPAPEERSPSPGGSQETAGQRSADQGRTIPPRGAASRGRPGGRGKNRRRGGKGPVSGERPPEAPGSGKPGGGKSGGPPPGGSPPPEGQKKGIFSRLTGLFRKRSNTSP
ncbi:MAG: DEAD/DEAH box helicase [Treponema sp.]|jgi:ATP-dependent RNA helicase RhlB|nr:DEAD/DEAH box helicase [Treponema sp.]